MANKQNPYRNARFLLEIDGIAKAGFSSATIPETSTEVVEYREGDERPTPRKLIGSNEYGDLTLETGVTDDSVELFEWWDQVQQGEVEAARRNIAVVVQDRGGEDGARWEFRDAWPRQYDAPDLDASANDVAIESLEIAHEGMVRSE